MFFLSATTVTILHKISQFCVKGEVAFIVYISNSLVLFFEFFFCRKNVPLLNAAKDFTVLIKNNVQFPKFGEAL